MWPFKKKTGPDYPSIAEIRMYYGLPRCGKTYCATDDILFNLRKHPSIHVYTNWPVFDSVSGKYTYKLTRDNIIHVPPNSDLYIDEAHFWYNSRLSLVKGKGMTEDEMSFFRTIGHRNVRVTFVTHHPDRLDVIIRNITHVFCEITKRNVPFTTRPLQFNLTYYLSENDMIGIMPKPADHKIRYFSKKTANAYDTHYFRHLVEPDYDFDTWAPASE